MCIRDSYQLTPPPSRFYLVHFSGELLLDALAKADMVLSLIHIFSLMLNNGRYQIVNLPGVSEENLTLTILHILLDHVPPAFIYWLIGEGVTYITGAVLYYFPKLPYMHCVFQLCVLGGTVCHMMALRYIL